LNLTNTEFKSITAILVLKIIGCLRSPFLSVVFAAIFSFITILLFFPSSVDSIYFIPIFKEVYGLLGVVSLGLTIGFVIISAWKLSLQSQQRKLKKSLFSFISGSQEPQFLTDDHQNIIFDNEASRRCFDKFELGQEVKIKELRELENLFDKNSKIIFARICENSISNRADAGELIFELGSAVEVSWKLVTEPVKLFTNLMLWRIEDVTEQRANEVERLNEENYIGDLLNQLPVGFFSADGDGNLRYLN
jgi:PAS domain-containing protein